MNKVILVQAVIKESKVAVFLRLAHDVVEKSLLEQGCLVYRLAKDLGQENTFLFYEKYESESALKMHRSSQYYMSFMEDVLPMLAGTPVIECLDA